MYLFNRARTLGVSMLIKRITDQVIHYSSTCGEVIEILKKEDGLSLGVAIVENTQETQAHYHLTFDELYFVLDGEISLQLYLPHLNQVQNYDLKTNELCVITQGIHHKIIKASEKNRLCVISTPPFHAGDEHPSDLI